MPFRPGEMLAGKYQVERLAGRMGLGFVIHVRHADLGQRFVLKCLSPEACRYPDAVARFLRGARAAMRLSSEYTARTIDAGRLASGSPYVVSEALAGCDLREMIRVRGALTVSEAVDFVVQAAESLAEAHSFGLVHKNLNLFTLFSTRRPDGSPRIKVLDFGVAEALRADPMRANELSIDATTVFGSNPMVEALGCSSPEQLRNHVEIDTRSDVWALGAVLHHMLCGYPVYHAETVPGLLAMIAADRPTPVTAVRSDVPAGLESVILRCLEKDRNARFATVAELAVALKTFATPDAQSGVDRITRTLGRSTRPPFTSYTSAIVHVGPAPSSTAPVSAPQHSDAPISEGRSPLIWSTALVAFGLVGGTIAGVLVATRTGMQGMFERDQLQQTVAAAQPSALPSTPSEATAAQKSDKDEASELAARSGLERSPKGAPRPRVAAPAALPPSTDAAATAPRRPRPNRAAAESALGNSQAREAAPPVNRSKLASANSVPTQSGGTGKDLFDSMR